MQLDGFASEALMFGYPISETLRGSGEPRRAFLAMPYGPSWFKSVRDTITGAANNQGFECEVTGDLRQPGPIIDHVWSGIREGDAVVSSWG